MSSTTRITVALPSGQGDVQDESAGDAARLIERGVRRALTDL
ncbi:hypothetical protein [Streptomyces sp. NPDC007020]